MTEKQIVIQISKFQTFGDTDNKKLFFSKKEKLCDVSFWYSLKTSDSSWSLEVNGMKGMSVWKKWVNVAITWS